jgi:hypothetical protein
MRLIRRQQSYIAVAVAIYAALIVISALPSSRNNPRPDVEVCAAV